MGWGVSVAVWVGSALPNLILELLQALACVSSRLCYVELLPSKKGGNIPGLGEKIGAHTRGSNLWV